MIILTGRQTQESICNHQRKLLKLKQRKQKVVQRMKKDLKNKGSKLKRKGKRVLRRKMDHQHHQRRGNPKRESKRLDVLCALQVTHSCSLRNNRMNDCYMYNLILSNFKTHFDFY